MKVISVKSLNEVYEVLKEVYNKNNGDIVFSKQKKYSLDNYMDTNELKVESTHQGRFDGSESYKWLEDKVGYRPVWSFMFSSEMYNDFEEFESAFSYGGGQGAYVFISNMPKDSIKTNFYNWVDVHYLLNDGSEEEIEEEEYKINMDYILDINDKDRIQVLSKSITENDIICILKIEDIY